MVLDILVAARGPLAEIVQPKSLNDTVLADQHAIHTLSTQSSIHSDSVQIDRAVSWRRGVGWNRHGGDISDGGLGYHDPEILVKPNKNGILPLLDSLRAEFGALNRRLNEARIILDDRVVLERMQEDDLGIDNDRVGHGDADITQVIRNNRSRDDNQALLRIDDQTEPSLLGLRESIELQRHDAGHPDKAANNLRCGRLAHAIQLDKIGLPRDRGLSRDGFGKVGKVPETGRVITDRQTHLGMPVTVNVHNAGPSGMKIPDMPV